MNSNDTDDAVLAARLQALRAGMDLLNAPGGVEKELMAAFASQHAKKRWHQRLSVTQWSTAGALGSAAAVLAVLMLAPPPSSTERAADGAQLAGLDQGAFIALESLERIEREPSPRVVAADLPRTMLAAVGVPVNPENAGESVRAEMLVAADGQPLALRLLVN